MIKDINGDILEKGQQVLYMVDNFGKTEQYIVTGVNPEKTLVLEITNDTTVCWLQEHHVNNRIEIVR